MEVVVHQHLVFELLDALLPRWKLKKYPYNRKDAIIPQRVIPEEIRKEKYVLACFYFYVCIYMRGGIESLQAFNALIRMWREHPLLFEPHHAQLMTHEEVQVILKRHIGWDSNAASINWIENSKRLVRNWNGDPLNLLKGLRSYDEACKRIRNKTKKGELKSVGPRNEGFRGFQYKMVSMLLYFYDWEEWLEKRFPYPSPADFHNFRLGIAKGAINILLAEGETARSSEQLSKPWRDAVLAYIVTRKADPVEVADAIWLYSLVMCGNSPATITKEKDPRKKEEPDPDERQHSMFHDPTFVERWSHGEWVAQKNGRLHATCRTCLFSSTCRPVPSQPYYRKGRIIIRSPLRVESSVGLDAVVVPARPEAPEPVQHILDFDDPADSS